MAFDPYWEWLEIPPNRQPPDFYALLGLAPFESELGNIRSAGLARAAHVRRFCLGPHGADATQLLAELANAFSCLEDPERKQAYDASLRAAHAPSNAASFTTGGAVSHEAAPQPPKRPPRPIPVSSVAAGSPPRAPEQAGGRRTTRRIQWTRLAARGRSRRRSAERTAVWLAGCCALLVAAIAVTARQEQILPDSVASKPADSAARPQNEPFVEPRPERAVSQPKDEPAPAELPGPTQPEPNHEPAGSRPVEVADEPIPAARGDSEVPPFFAAPGRKPRAEFPRDDEQAPPPAASKDGGLRAAAEPNGADEPNGAGDPSAEADESLEKLKRLQAEQKLQSGVDALQAGDYEDAINQFAAAIEECDYRDNEITSLAARRLDDALRSYKAVGNGRSEIVRDAQGVLKEFRNRIKRSKRRPADKR